MVKKPTISMTYGKVVFYILLVIFIIQVEFSQAEATNINSDLIKKLVIEAAKHDDCSRRITVQHILPLRFRRAPTNSKFPCVIK
ncbi:unnamed protein product, partial [Rotaria sp. Silwood2]